jgi:hypothetical protein
MTDHQVFNAATISPDVIRLMATVFDEVARERGLSPRNDPICELVAEAILDCARRVVAIPSQCADAHTRRLGSRKHQQPRPFGTTTPSLPPQWRVEREPSTTWRVDVCPLRHSPSPRARSGRQPRLPRRGFFFGDCGECLAVNPSAARRIELRTRCADARRER